MQMVDLLSDTLVTKWREHGGTLSVSVHEVFPVNPQFNSILLHSVHKDSFKATAGHFGIYYTWEAFDEKLDSTLTLAR